MRVCAGVRVIAGVRVFAGVCVCVIAGGIIFGSALSVFACRRPTSYSCVKAGAVAAGAAAAAKVFD